MNTAQNELTLKLGKWNTMKWSADCVDPSLDDILEGFYGCLIGHTYDPAVVVRHIKEWAEEKYEAMDLKD